MFLFLAWMIRSQVEYLRDYLYPGAQSIVITETVLRCLCCEVDDEPLHARERWLPADLC